MIKLETIGADPEFAIVDSKGNGIGSFIHFEGTKGFPEKTGEGFAILKDNLLVEGNVPPSTTKEGFITVMKKIKSQISDRIEGAGHKILCADEISFSDDFIFTEAGMDFGCSAYIDVYSEDVRPTPELMENSRSIGAHIHIGYNITNDNNTITDDQFNIAIGKAMDFFIGIPSDQIMKSEYRRETYGQLGAIRNTAYGLEYRSLGGYFLNDEFLEWQYDQTKKAIDFVANEENFEKLKAVSSADEKFYDFLEINLMEQVPETKLIEA